MGTKERLEILQNSDNVINNLLKRISNLEYEVERLEKNRDKAIEYISCRKYPFCDEHELKDDDGKEIIKILKGE